jgi:23S rRNA maturation mini-RNase III
MCTKFWLESLSRLGSEDLGRRLDDNIKMYVTGTGLEAVEWIHLAEDRDRFRALVDTVMNLRLP